MPHWFCLTEIVINDFNQFRTLKQPQTDIYERERPELLQNVARKMESNFRGINAILLLTVTMFNFYFNLNIHCVLSHSVFILLA